MKSKFLLIAMLLLSACATTTNSAIDVVCALELPTVSQADTDLTLQEVDVFSERFRAACGK